MSIRLTISSGASMITFNGALYPRGGVVATPAGEYVTFTDTRGRLIQAGLYLYSEIELADHTTFNSTAAFMAWAESHLGGGGSSSGGGVQNLTDAASIPMDYGGGSTGILIVNGTRQLTIDNLEEGAEGNVLVIQGATGGALVLDGNKPHITWAVGQGEKDLLHFVFADGELYWTWQSYAHTVALTQMIGATPNGGYPRAVLDVNGGYVGLAANQAEYVTLWNGSPVNSKIGDIVAGATPYTFKGINGIGITELQVRYMDEIFLTNFNNLVIPSFPVGIFATDGTFQSNAASMAALVAQRNSGYAGGGISYADIGSTYSIGVLKTSPTVFAADFKVMRYWFTDAQGASNIYTSGTATIIKADGTKVAASAGTPGVFGPSWNFGLNTITYGARYTDVSPIANVPLVDVTEPYYINSLTVGTNYIYHNEVDGKWAWMDVFGNCANNGGNLPPSVRFVSMQRFNTDNNAVNISLGNIANLSSLIGIEALSFNGIATSGGVIYNPSWMAYFPNLKTWQMINRSFTTSSLTSLGLNKTSLPNLEFILNRRSPSAVFTVTAGEWANLAPLVKGCDLAGAGVSVAGEDIIINETATAMGSATAYSTARLTTQYQNNVRTSASDTAAATLTSKGFTLL